MDASGTFVAGNHIIAITTIRSNVCSKVIHIPYSKCFEYGSSIYFPEGEILVTKGDLYKCDVCGVVCAVDEVCGCAECDLICCNTPMRKVGRKKTRRIVAKKKRK
ncbi:MAG: hypothetical protein QXI59_03335 [Candidatus Bathyarchaeia archaeon]